MHKNCDYQIRDLPPRVLFEFSAKKGKSYLRVEIADQEYCLLLRWLRGYGRLLRRELGRVNLGHGTHHILLMKHSLASHWLLHIHHVTVHHHVHRIYLIHLLLAHHI